MTPAASSLLHGRQECREVEKTSARSVGFELLRTISQENGCQDECGDKDRSDDQ
jgi:hypothetical protein